MLNSKYLMAMDNNLLIRPFYKFCFIYGSFTLTDQGVYFYQEKFSFCSIFWEKVCSSSDVSIASWSSCRLLFDEREYHLKCMNNISLNLFHEMPGTTGASLNLYILFSFVWFMHHYISILLTYKTNFIMSLVWQASTILDHLIFVYRNILLK